MELTARDWALSNWGLLVSVCLHSSSRCHKQVNETDEKDTEHFPKTNKAAVTKPLFLKDVNKLLIFYLFSYSVAV